MLAYHPQRSKVHYLLSCLFSPIMTENFGWAPESDILPIFLIESAEPPSSGLAPGKM